MKRVKFIAKVLIIAVLTLPPKTRPVIMRVFR
jgi:hypothetical protein